MTYKYFLSFLLVCTVSGFTCAHNAPIPANTISVDKIGFTSKRDINNISIKKIRLENIKSHALLIEKNINFDHYVNISLRVGTGLFYGYALYKVLKSLVGFLNKSDSNENSGSDNNESNSNNNNAPSNPDDTRTWGQFICGIPREIVGGIISIPSGVADIVTSKDSWVGVAKLLAEAGATLVVQKVTGDILNKVDHSNTIVWFIRKRANFRKTIRELDNYAQILEESGAPQQEKEYAHQAFVATVNELVCEVEKICGFITYKVSQLPKSKRTHAYAIVAYLVKTTNDFVDIIEQEREKIASDNAVFITHLNEFKVKLDREAKLFAHVDVQKDFYTNTQRSVMIDDNTVAVIRNKDDE